MNIRKPVYQSSGIGSLDALALALRLDKRDLISLANAASDKYHSFDIEKKDGRLRNITAPDRDLKLVQKRINRQIFANVVYPDYLFGGIVERDYFKNAQSHSGAKALIALDVQDFYPSLKSFSVKKIFQYFCKFSPDVSDVLTKLTTLNGTVPQGACTSSHLANLVFFEGEHMVVHQLQQKKIVYSRLLDDVCLSSRSALSKKQVDQSIDLVARLLKSANCKLKSSKTSITSASNPETLMYVTGLWINRGHPRVDSADRVSIRAEVNRCVNLGGLSRETNEYHELHNKVSGKVSKLAYIGHGESSELRTKLRRVLPLFDVGDEFKTRQIVQSLTRTSKDVRSSIVYFERFHQAMYRVNIHFRNNRDFAWEMKKILRKHWPLINREELYNGE